MTPQKFSSALSYWPVCPTELDRFEEAEPRSQPAYQDPNAAAISRGAQDEPQPAEGPQPSLFHR